MRIANYVIVKTQHCGMYAICDFHSIGFVRVCVFVVNFAFLVDVSRIVNPCELYKGLETPLCLHNGRGYSKTTWIFHFVMFATVRSVTQAEHCAIYTAPTLVV